MYKDCHIKFYSVGGKPAPYFNDGEEFFYAPNEGFDVCDKEKNFRQVHNYHLLILSDEDIKVGDVVYKDFGGVLECTQELLFEWAQRKIHYNPTKAVSGNEYDYQDGDILKKVIASTKPKFTNEDGILFKLLEIPEDFLSKVKPKDKKVKVKCFGNTVSNIDNKIEIMSENKVNPISPEEIVNNYKLPDFVIDSITKSGSL